MRTFFALFSTTFILGALAQITPNQTYAPGQDNYPFKTTVTNAKQTGFTIEYKNYYKIITNLITNTKYCVVGWNQLMPSDCSADTTFKTPINLFNVDKDSYNVIPFIELLNLTSNLATSTIASKDVSSPCIQDATDTTSIVIPQIVFSSAPGNPHVSFSGDSDQLDPIEKATWLLYVGAFFDLEVTAATVLNQITSNYECHKNNARNNPPKSLSWTYYDLTNRIFTIRGDEYFTQLVQDAGGTLVTPNVLQNKTFPTSSHLFALDIQGADFIVDESDPSVDYEQWYNAAGDIYLNPNSSYAHVKAIKNNAMYSINGLVNTNNISDWSQRSAARPDLALLDLIRLFNPDFQLVSGTEQFPLWLIPFQDMQSKRRTVSKDNYGQCGDMVGSVKSQTACVIGGGGGAKQYQDLAPKDKAGISVGVIVFVVAVAFAGLWYYRRHQRNKRHNFYRMNDL